MNIVQIYSHLNGLEYLLVHKKALWDEVKSVVESIDMEACRTKISQEKTMVGKALISPKELNKKFAEEFDKLGWKQQITRYWVTDDDKIIKKTILMKSDEQKESIVKAGKMPIMSYNQTDFVKDRVAIEVQFGKYSFIAYDLFVKHMAFYVGDVIDIGIEIVPMKNFQSQMSSGPGYFEGELYNLLRQGRGIPAVPLILVGVGGPE